MSDRASDITDISERTPSTTTISTVAVQAGRSKVVLAILRVSDQISNSRISGFFHQTHSQAIIMQWFLFMLDGTCLFWSNILHVNSIVWKTWF